MASLFRVTPALFLAGCLFVAVDDLGAIAQSKAPEGPFDAQLRTIAKDYQKWGRVDDEFRWAPFLCRAPMPAVARFSGSDDETTHGQKLYSLFANDRAAYMNSGTKPNAVGQVVVKQSWIPEEIKDDGQSLDSKAERRANAGSTMLESFLPYARRDGKLFKASKQADLFVMFKLDPKTADTDQGWVYGTVSADGAKVTAAGRIESCMGCHTKTKNDRLFGLSNSPR